MNRDDEEDAPWRKGSGVQGVRPPERSRVRGRHEPAWSASGVRGVTPPGSMPKDRRPRDLWKQHQTREREAAKQAMKRARKRTAGARSAEAPPFARPVAGHLPQSHLDPCPVADFPQVFEELKCRLAQAELDEASAEEFAMVIRQSSAPFEVVVAFAVLTAAVQDRRSLRRQFGRELERGIECTFNLMERLGLEPEVPDEFEPERMDVLFFGFPDSGLEMPFAHLTVTLEHLIQLFEEDVAEAVVAPLIRELRASYIQGRSHGDQSLEEMFPAPDGLA